MMVGIRVDVNNIIATGHIIRTITIAEELGKRNEKFLFISSDNGVVPFLKKAGYPYHILNSDWTDKESEIDSLIKVIKEYDIKELLVDSYQVTEKYFKIISEYVNITYFDELYLKGFSKCKNLINGLIIPPDYEGCSANVYKGPAYVPLRKEFREINKKPVNSEISRILVTSGGGDNFNFISKFLNKFLSNKSFNKVKIDVAVGALYPNKEKLLNNLKNGRVTVHIAASNMSELICGADMVVMAGGMTTYEVCACGTPGIVFSMAENQVEQCKAFYKLGILYYAGDLRNGEDSVIEEIINKIEQLRDYELRNIISVKMMKIVDGQGASRIADILVKRETVSEGK